MTEIDDNSVDLIFTDLPYGQVSCEWDKKIDFPAMWEQFMRIKKLNAPIFFCCSTKFGAEIINSAPKKCPFRYDIVWVKSAPAGFLCAKKMPMRKHEMLYVFYEKLPFYDLSSHSHKFIKEVPTKRAGKDGVDNKGMIKNRCKSGMETQTKYDPPLPVSVIKEPEPEMCKYDVSKNAYGGGEEGRIKISKDKREHETRYDPPLPVSVIKENPDYENRDKKTRDTIKKEEVFGKSYLEKKVNFRKFDPTLGGTGAPSHLYDPPLPVSVVKEGCGLNKGGLYSGSSIEDSGIKTTTYDPPLPHSILEIKSQRGKHATQKPTELMKWVLKYYSKEGDVVLDPTMGSGSTGVACKEMNRNFIGIEMDPEIFEVAQNRLEIS
jgi:DNA modification methylase